MHFTDYADNNFIIELFPRWFLNSKAPFTPELAAWGLLYSFFIFWKIVNFIVFTYFYCIP